MLYMKLLIILWAMVSAIWAHYNVSTVSTRLVVQLTAVLLVVAALNGCAVGGVPPFQDTGQDVIDRCLQDEACTDTLLYYKIEYNLEDEPYVERTEIRSRVCRKAGNCTDTDAL